MQPSTFKAACCFVEMSDALIRKRSLFECILVQLQMKKDIMALRLMEKIGKRMTSQMKPTAEKPATVGAVVGDQGSVVMA